MEWRFVFFLNSALLGVGLAMDAFSVSMANGLHDPRMSRKTMCRIAGTFALFQAVMPMTGWVCVRWLCWAILAAKCLWMASRAKRPKKQQS